MIDRLNRETHEMLRAPATRQKYASAGLDLMPTTPDEMNERIRNEYPVWSKVMRQAGIEPE